MSMVWFLWQNKQLALVMNRDNCTNRKISKAAWDDEGQILAGRCGHTGGTWFGVTKAGRVAFLVDYELMTRSIDAGGRDPNRIPMQFLKGDLSPEMFAAELTKEENEFHVKLEEERGDEDDENFGRKYKLVVADITSGSMVYIRKNEWTLDCDVHSQAVASGVHTLSLYGLDSDFHKDVSLRNMLNELIRQNENQERHNLWDELVDKFWDYPTEDFPGYVLPTSKPDNDCYTTTSTTTFIVDHTKQAVFNEMYGENEVKEEFKLKIA